MSDARCHSCGAAVPPEAQWCSLCFADLRAPALREPVSVPAAPIATPDVQAAPIAVAQPAVLPTAAPVAVAPETVWPCPRCGAKVAIALDACPDCGAGFLSGIATTTSTKLPLVGDVGRMSQGQRLLIGGGISIVLMVVFVLLLEVGGHLFG